MAATRSARAADPFVARNFWLAGLGLAAVARRESGNTVRTFVGEACRQRGNAVAFARDARDVARGVAITVLERVEPAAARVIPAFESRMAPVLEKLGLATAPRGPARRVRKASPRRRAAKSTRR